MKTEKIANCCPKCQAPLPVDAAQGLCAKCLLAAVATPTEAGQPPGQHSAPPLAAVTAAFPQLEIIELIGMGGMGVVFKARQPKLDRFVALKVLPQSLAADAAFAERFNREARVLARLNHPNIVTVHDFGQSGGFFYLLMEFVDGVNLRQAMQAGRFSPQQALLLVPKICEALQFAHEEGILHRDIKPENILLDTRGRAKIADFGIAKLVGEAKENITLTASGLAIGTPQYMAPEQLEHPQDVDQRADIYSLGVVFYELLTGELPLGRFAPPSQKSAVDPRVDEVVFHALEKEREKRFRSAGEVKTSVEAITAHPRQTQAGGAAAMGPAGTIQLPVGASPALASAELSRRSTCYFNTPPQMRDCFPGAAARVFLCKGELQLSPENLTFISQWRTTIMIPLKDIHDLSIGQFQMWTTPWVMKYARINFLSITFMKEGGLQTVLFTPVPEHATSEAQINDSVSGWFESIQQAVIARAGTAPHSSEPAATAVSAEPAWGRKGWPLFAAFLLVWIAIYIVLPYQSAWRVPPPVWNLVVILGSLLLVGNAFYTAGFLRADRALKRGNLDAVTSDDPPAPNLVDGPGTNPPGGPRRPFGWTFSAYACMIIGVCAAIETLASSYMPPYSVQLSPGIGHLFAGLALLSLGRRWRVTALTAVAVMFCWQSYFTVHDLLFSPATAGFSFPFLKSLIPWFGGVLQAKDHPVLLATTIVLGIGIFAWPFCLLTSAPGKVLFGIDPNK